MAKSERRTREQRAAKKTKTAAAATGKPSRYAAKRAAKLAALQLPDDPRWRDRQRPTPTTA